jgi:adenosylcobinamide-GDP ribazoletransferase
MWCGLAQSAWPPGTLLAALWQSSLAMALAAGVCARWFMRRLGGFTGDTLGAAQQVSEVAGLLAWLAVVHPVG